METFILIVNLEPSDGTPKRSIRLQMSAGDRVAEVLRQSLFALGIKDDAARWQLVFLGKVLLTELVIGPIFRGHTQIELTLQTIPEDSASSACDLRVSIPPLEDEYELSLDDDSAVGLEASAPVMEESGTVFEEEEPVALPRRSVAPGAPAPSAAAAPAPAKKPSGQYQATVRYYNRMNPQRVYPFLVILTKEMVERIKKQDVEQRVSGPFQVDRSKAIEVEPILPGCACYPAKQTARLDGKDLTLTFHVVPNVLGAVTGAHVAIRQDHRTLTTVELDARVVKRTSVVVCGFLTVALPFASSMLRHAGIELPADEQSGFSYIEVIRTILEKTPPPILALVFGSLTAIFYWLTRPREKDLFAEVKLIRPADLLKQIVARKDDDAEAAAADLVDLLTAHPEFKEGWIVYAQWHYEARDFAAALEGYEKARALGTMAAKDYLRASLAASQLGKNKAALGILQTAEQTLPAKEMTGAMLFNMGCYNARLGHLDKVVPLLERAFKKGYHKMESYEQDADLNPVRNRADFLQFMRRLNASSR